jgi:hypothetical protein
MESIDDNFNKAGFAVSEVSSNNLLSTAKWAMFLGIIGFIFLGLMVIAGLGIISAGSQMPSYAARSMPISLEMIGFLYIVMAGIGFYPAYCLVKFSSKMQDSIRTKATMTFDEATGYLKGHYTFAGIMTIVVIGLYLIAIMITIANRPSFL